jgi:hypothetical protein
MMEFYNNNRTVRTFEMMFKKLKCDLPVFWTLFGAIVEAQRRSKGHFLLLETPYYAPR